MPMRAAGEGKPSVLVDARALRGSGIARYLREILARLLDDDRFGTVTLLGDPGTIAGFVAARGNGSERVRVLPLATAFYSPWMQLQWLVHRGLGRLRADVAFFPHYDVPVLLGGTRSVVTVQDLTHFMVPELFAKWKRAVASQVFDRAVTSAARVVVTSRSTERDLVRRLPRVAGKIELIPLGVGEPFLGAEGAIPQDVEALRPYLLFVGNRKPHKNLTAAIEALAMLREERPELRLVLAGYSFPGWDAARARARELDVEEALIELSDVSDERLCSLYLGCETLLLPSLYEGFGLPVLEAMACGAPVVASDRASVPEVVGDAGLVVDPERPGEIAEAVRRIAREDGLRARLIERGAVRARELTWDKTAERTVNLIYDTAVGVKS